MELLVSWLEVDVESSNLVRGYFCCQSAISVIGCWGQSVTMATRAAVLVSQSSLGNSLIKYCSDSQISQCFDSTRFSLEPLLLGNLRSEYINDLFVF